MLRHLASHLSPSSPSSTVLVALAFALGAAVAAVTLGSGCAPSFGDYVVDARDAHASNTRSDAVVGGVQGTAAQVGATVSLVMFGESGCTGTLIAPRVVATAAHCIFDVSADQLEIVVGSLVPASAPSTQSLAVQSVSAHPEFSMFGGNQPDELGLADERDIGVVVLAEPAPSSIVPAPVVSLADFDSILSEGELVEIAGYGLTSSNENVADYGRLYVAQTPYRTRSASEFVAGDAGDPDTCNGDSGGPAYALVNGERRLAGITSRAAFGNGGFECGDTGGIYTMFGAFEQWVEEESGGLYDGDGGGVDLPPPPPPPEGAGSCANSCDDVAPDGSCFCDAFCSASGDCCDDFAAECPDVPEWTCGLEDLEDQTCDCDCGAPDFACADGECAGAPGGEGEGEGEGEGDSGAGGDGGDDGNLGATGDNGDDDLGEVPDDCNSARGETQLALAALLVLAASVRRRRRRCP